MNKVLKPTSAFSFLFLDKSKYAKTCWDTLYLSSYESRDLGCQLNACSSVRGKVATLRKGKITSNERQISN